MMPHDRIIFTLGSVILLACVQTNSGQELECLEDRRPGLGMAQGSNQQYVLGEPRYDLFDETECEKSCCSRMNECNVAVYERRRNGDFVCTLLKCDPFENCEWEPKMSSSVSQLALINETKAEKTYESAIEKEEEWEEQRKNGSDVPIEATTVNMTALEEEEKEEIDEEFQKEFGNSKWNINYDNVDTDSGEFQATPTATSNPTGEGWDDWDNWIDQAAQNNHKEDNDNPENLNKNTDNVDNINKENDIDIDEGSDENDNDDELEIENTSEGASDTTAHEDNHKPEHSNNGMWGPTKIHDIDYDESDYAPFIVLGVIASVVFILMVLIFVAKRLSMDTERLKYRPLNESFPSSTPYHDHQNYGQYHDIE